MVPNPQNGMLGQTVGRLFFFLREFFFLVFLFLAFQTLYYYVRNLNIMRVRFLNGLEFDYFEVQIKPKKKKILIEVVFERA